MNGINENNTVINSYRRSGEKHMVMFYFSGTGNSKYIAELFCQNINAVCHSIEESEEGVDFEKLIAAEEIIGFCYPVYASRVPRTMREFVVKHIASLKGKKLIIFCTQVLFSGDGARAFAGIFPRNFIKVIYAEHFRMPNNVCNFFLTPLESERKVKRYVTKAEHKMRLVCGDIEGGIVKKRGFNIVSRILGLPQGACISILEKKGRDSVKINGNCAQCGLCVSVCPMSNFEYANGAISPKGNCAICYRCINKCPQKAISVFIRGKVKRQYRGVNRI